MAKVQAVDIAIIGGGMVGTSLASMLAAALPHLSIALIESQPLVDNGQAYQPSFDARSTALAQGSVEILRELGVWQRLAAHVTAIRQVHVSDRGHLLGGLIDAGEQSLDAVGYVVENAWLGQVLLGHVQAQANIQCLAPASVEQINPLADGVLLEVTSPAGGFSLHARLAVVADGGDSPLRRALGIATQVRDYGQTALITNLEFSQPHAGIAYERFTEQGPIALLPLGESPQASRAALVWTLPAEQADAVMALPDGEFLARLQQEFGFRAGRFTRVAKRFAYPLQLVLAEEQIRSHLVLLGNAAHFLHPVAGQGFNLALRDCAALVESLRLMPDKSPGDLALLQSYMARQSLDQQLTLEFSDKLVRLFSSAQLPLVALRHLGLLSLETLAPLKRRFAAHTMGTGGRQFRWRELPAGDGVVVPASAVAATACAPQMDIGQVDLAIVGAGLVGASLACAVAQAAPEWRIAVIEAGGETPRYQGVDFDPRVVALTLASQQLLAQIGCWDAIVAQRLCAYSDMKVWDGEGTAAIHFDAAEVRQPQLGYIVENSVIVQALRQRMAQLGNIQLLQPAAVESLVQRETATDKTIIHLSSGASLDASLLIAADGARSKVRELAGFSTREWDYGQQAIITTVRSEKSHEFTAWQRFMHTGPLAFLPLQHQGDSHYCSIVWSADTALAEQLMALDDCEFCARLGAAFEYRLGAVEHCAQRFAIPLRQRHASHYVQPGIALVGDAAHNIHPLAGQGVNLGLLDVAVLAQELARARQRGLPLQDESILRRYQRQRLAGNLGMMGAMEAFKRLFGSRNLAVNWLRNAGVRQLDSLPAIKKIIINNALGIVD